MFSGLHRGEKRMGTWITTEGIMSVVNPPANVKGPGGEAEFFD